jgi:glycosyltransferase involved in cell wall biosynthesis
VKAVDILLVGDLRSAHIRRLATAMVDRGFGVEIATIEGEPIAGAVVHHLATSRRVRPLAYLLAIPRLMRIVRTRRPGVVNAHYLSSFGLMTAIAIGLSGMRHRTALIQTAWGTDLLVTAQQSRVRRVLAAFALRRAAAMTGDSRDVLAIANRLAPRTPAHRFVFGPDAALLASDEPPAQVVVSIRRLDPDTRVDLVVDAFREAARVHPAHLAGWKLIVAGEGSAAGAVQAAANNDPSVQIVGHLHSGALRELLATARVAVSVPVSDATSASLLEALAAGMNLVVNDLPANREWVDVATAEIVSRDPSVTELADAIARAADRPIARAVARARVRDISWESQVAGLEELYEAVASSLAPTSRWRVG